MSLLTQVTQRATTTPMATTLLCTPPGPRQPMPPLLTLTAMFLTLWTMWRARHLVMILLELSTIILDPLDPLDSMQTSSMKNDLRKHKSHHLLSIYFLIYFWFQQCNNSANYKNQVK